MIRFPLGSPPGLVIAKPGTLPSMDSSGEVTPTEKSLEDILEMAPVTSFFLAVPYPVTTTSFKEALEGTKEAVMFVWEETSISCAAKPTELITKVFALAETDSLKAPAASVAV